MGFVLQEAISPEEALRSPRVSSATREFFTVSWIKLLCLLVWGQVVVSFGFLFIFSLGAILFVCSLYIFRLVGLFVWLYWCSVHV